MEIRETKKSYCGLLISLQLLLLTNLQAQYCPGDQVNSDNFHHTLIKAAFSKNDNSS
jgi:hypothetical protein